MSVEKLKGEIQRLRVASTERREEQWYDPSGEVELSDEELGVPGIHGEHTECFATLGCCVEVTREDRNTCCCSLDPRVCRGEETVTVTIEPAIASQGREGGPSPWHAALTQDGVDVSAADTEHHA